MGVPKWLQSIANATIRASIADAPAVTTASGYTINSKTGEVTQDATEDPGVKQLRDNLTVLGGTATGITAAPVVGAVVSNPVAQKLIGDAAASMLGGEVVDKTYRALTGQSFGRGVASIFGQQNVYDRSALARFGYDSLNPGYFAGNLIAKGTNAAIDAAGSALKNVDNYITIQNALRTGKLRFGEPTTYTGIHQSSTPLTKPKFPFYERWDVRTHGADPDGFWLTIADSPNTTGTMADRPYASRWSATSQKPLIQIGEVNGLLGKKNNTRNAIVKYGRKHGADAFEFKGIADNKLPETDVVMVSGKTNPQYLGGVGQVRYAGPTTGKSTFIKANPDSGLVDLDAVPGYKQLRKNVAKQLGLDWKSPKVTDSPEYQQAFNDFIRDWTQNTENTGKTLFGSAKGLLRGDNPLAGKSFIPDFETFVARNQARGFKENPEQLRAWYNSIIDSYPEIKIDNRFVGEIPFYNAPKTSVKSIQMKEPIMAKPLSNYEIKGLGGGYMLKSLMRGNPLEKQISKNGTVNVNNVRDLIGKGSNVEQAVVNKVLASEEFAGKKSIDYNKLRKAIQNELITYERTPDTRYQKYGAERIGQRIDDTNLASSISDAKDYDHKLRNIDRFGSEEEKLELTNLVHKIRKGKISESEYDAAFNSLYNKMRARYSDIPLFDTYTFSSPRIPSGSGKHYNANTLGHSRTYTTADEPDVLHVMESQSDWAQSRGQLAPKHAPINITEENFKEFLSKHPELEFVYYKNENDLSPGWSAAIDGLKIDYPDILQYIKKTPLKDTAEANQIRYLSDNYTSRQIQENLRYAAEKGQTKMRYPTRETAAKIEGYQKSRSQSLQDNPELQKQYDELRDALRAEENRIVKKYAPKDYLEESLREADFGDMGLSEEETEQLVDRIRRSEEFERSADGAKMREEIVKARERMDPDKWLRENVKEKYLPQHETILRKYDVFPKQFNKLFKNSNVRTVTDRFGNSWYEVDVPENYLQQEWTFKQGGKIKSIFNPQQ